MSKKLRYSHLKLSVAELVKRISKSPSWALRGNSYAEGAIICTPVCIVDGQKIYQQFEYFKDGFRDLGLCTL